jgi:hypothetical protein
MRVLAGDIGGTKTALAIVEITGRRLALRRLRRFPSRDHGSLEEILALFLKGLGSPPRAAGFGVAGPVEAGRARVTKLPWVLDERRLSAATGIARVRLINDFVAAALGIPYIGSASRRPRAGRASRGAIGLIGAGTGLGRPRSSPVRTIRARRPEGGHADFGPRDPVEDRLVRLSGKSGRVTATDCLGRRAVSLRFLQGRRFRVGGPAVARAQTRTVRRVSRFGPRAVTGSAGRFPLVPIHGSEAGTGRSSTARPAASSSRAASPRKIPHSGEDFPRVVRVKTAARGAVVTDSDRSSSTRASFGAARLLTDRDGDDAPVLEIDQAASSQVDPADAETSSSRTADPMGLPGSRGPHRFIPFRTSAETCLPRARPAPHPKQRLRFPDRGIRAHERARQASTRP